MVPSIFRNPSIFTDPFLEFDELLSRAKNAVNTFEVSDISFPKFNIYQDKLGNLKLEATVAGWSKEDIEIELKDGYITISADTQKQDENWTRVYSGAKTSKFKTTIKIPQSEKFDFSLIEANSDNGMLYIIVPKKKSTIDNEKGIKISIK